MVTFGRVMMLSIVAMMTLFKNCQNDVNWNKSIWVTTNTVDEGVPTRAYNSIFYALFFSLFLKYVRKRQ
jgi:hypothetical protein